MKVRVEYTLKWISVFFFREYIKMRVRQLVWCVQTVWMEKQNDNTSTQWQWVYCSLPIYILSTLKTSIFWNLQSDTHFLFQVKCECELWKVIFSILLEVCSIPTTHYRAPGWWWGLNTDILLFNLSIFDICFETCGFNISHSIENNGM